MFYKCILLPEGTKKNKTQIFKKQRATLQIPMCDLCDGSRCEPLMVTPPKLLKLIKEHVMFYEQLFIESK